MAFINRSYSYPTFIREVMSEAATEDVVKAWAEAYGFLTEILTGRGGQIYT